MASTYVTEAELRHAIRVAERVLIGMRRLGLAAPLEPTDPPVPFLDGLTQQEMAALLGVSRQRAAQIEQRALSNLRRWCGAHGLTRDDL